MKAARNPFPSGYTLLNLSDLGSTYAQWQGPVHRLILRCEFVEQTEPRVDADGEDVDKQEHRDLAES
jgi:hypothetical protein